MWKAVKELLRGTFIALNACNINRKEGTSKINNVFHFVCVCVCVFHFKKLEKEQTKSKGRRIKEIKRFRDEIKNRKSTEIKQ